MVAHIAIAILAAIALAGTGAAIAVDNGAFTSSGSGVLDLGTLSPGQNGTASTTATISVANNTTYKLQRTMEDRTGSVFSSMLASVSVNGTTYNMSMPGEDCVFIHLTSGNYTVSVNLNYTVRGMVHSVNASKVPFLFLQPIEHGDNAGFHHHDNDTGSNNGTASASVSVTPYDNGDHQDHGNSSRITLASLTYKVNGNAGGNHGHSNDGQAKGKDSVEIAPAA